MAGSNNDDEHVHMRVAIIGANRMRVAKVLSLISDQPTLTDRDDEPQKRQIHVDYIPCVATFDSYENENGDSIKYLMKLEHHGTDGNSRGASLAPVFDEVVNGNKMNHTHVPGIAGISVGCGLETDEEVTMISSFMKSLSGGKDEDFVIDCVKPNSEYMSMKEETLAYKNLSAEEKKLLTESQTTGPAKMAKFTLEVAQKSIPRSKLALEIERREHEKALQEIEDVPKPPPMPPQFDDNLTRFACKMCRTILFSEAELEDPPHTQAQHNFSIRKTKSGANTNNSSKCQSYFLADALDWMGDINLSHEGKLSCPKCSGKLGLYKWHGTQCSCGTWVVPAIMVQKGRVDLIQPHDSKQTNDPLAAVANPLAGLYIGGQS